MGIKAIDSLETPTLPAVIYPPTVLLVPFQMAIMNIVVNTVLMLMGIAIFNVGPVPFILFIIVGHIFLIRESSKDPHLYSLSRANARFANIIPWKSRFPALVRESQVRCKMVP